MAKIMAQLRCPIIHIWNQLETMTQLPGILVKRKDSWKPRHTDSFCLEHHILLLILHEHIKFQCLLPATGCAEQVSA